MKYRIFLFIIIALLAGVARADNITTTPNLGLSLPPLGNKGAAAEGWQNYMNNNFTAIDTAYGPLHGLVAGIVTDSGVLLQNVINITAISNLVTPASPTEGQVITYDVGTSLWRVATVTPAGTDELVKVGVAGTPQRLSALYFVSDNVLGHIRPINRIQDNSTETTKAWSASKLSHLPQEYTHYDNDSDASASSLHHTLGTGATQAAAGNHQHGMFGWKRAYRWDLTGGAVTQENIAWAGQTANKLMFTCNLAKSTAGIFSVYLNLNNDKNTAHYIYGGLKQDATVPQAGYTATSTGIVLAATSTTADYSGTIECELYNFGGPRTCQGSYVSYNTANPDQLLFEPSYTWTNATVNVTELDITSTGGAAFTGYCEMYYWAAY